MGDPLLQFKRWEGEELGNHPITLEAPMLLSVAGGMTQPIDGGIVGTRILAGALTQTTPREVSRIHVLEAVMPAQQAAELGSMLFRAAVAAGWAPPQPDVVEAEMVDGREETP